MVIVGLQLDGGKEQIQISEGLLLLSVASAIGMALAGFALVIYFMNPKYPQSFLGRLSFRQYVVELWGTRTYAPVGKGLDASRAELLNYSR